MKVIVIGAGGKMGQWFTRYFSLKKSELFVYDLNTEGLKYLSKAYGASIVEDLHSEIKDADVALVSIPIEKTGQMVLELAKSIKKDSIIIEISSLKKIIMPKIREAVKKGARILSLHPMFGPGAKNLTGHKIVVVNINDMNMEIEEVRKLFPEADIASSSVEEHDKTMGIVLSLTHFINIIFSAIITKNDLARIRKLSGTSLNFQLLLAESIMQDEPSFLAALQITNSYSKDFIEDLINEARNLKEMINLEDDINLEKYITNIKKKLIEDKDYSNSYSKMYNIIDSI